MHSEATTRGDDHGKDLQDNPGGTARALPVASFIERTSSVFALAIASRSAEQVSRRTQI